MHRPLSSLHRHGLAWSAALALATTAVAAHAAGAHRHGVAAVDIVADGSTLAVTLDIPLDDLVGFERAPRSDAERGRVAQALARLRDPAALLAADPAAGCSPGSTELVAPVLGLGSSGRPAADGHAELQATWTFTCRAAEQAAWIDLRLFEAFPRLQRIEVQAASGRGQSKATLRRGNARVVLSR